MFQPTPLAVASAVSLVALAAGGAFYHIKVGGGASSSLAGEHRGDDDDDDDDDDIVEQFKTGSKKLLLVFGSQTGTAIEFARAFQKEALGLGLGSVTVDPEDEALDELLPRVAQCADVITVFFLATYGNGDPTDNFVGSHDWLEGLGEGDGDVLAGLRFLVFGLGNSTYEHFNMVSRFVSKQLKIAGASEIQELCLGDENMDIEQDFEEWQKAAWPVLFASLGMEEPVEAASVRMFNLTECASDCAGIYTGEREGAKIGSLAKQTKPYTQQNPFLAEVVAHRELITGGGRSCMHIELDIAGADMPYTTGDHVGIYAANDEGVVEGLCRRLGVDPDTVFRLEPLDGGTRPALPSPCSYRTAFTHYLDIMGALKAKHTRELAMYASDPRDRDFLERISGKDGKDEFGEWVTKQHRTLLGLLEAMGSLAPDVGHLVEILPPLQPRYYSISSSSKMYPTAIHVTAMRVDMTTPRGERHGVCTGHLATLQVGARVPIFVRTSLFRLPRSMKPIIMVGPGTGVAPFRAFLQDRQIVRGKSDDSLGDAMLFFGCRREAEDFLYKEELVQSAVKGLVSLYTAFSRETAKKVYVQHRLLEHKAAVWNLLDQGAHVFICGDGSAMAKDVRKALVEIIEVAGDRTGAHKGDEYLKRMDKQGRFHLDVW